MERTRPELGAEGVAVRTLGRGKLIAGAMGAAVASLLGRPKAARADDVEEAKELVLGAENIAGATTSLLADTDGAALELANRTGGLALVGSSLLPRQTGISQTLQGVALAGLGRSTGVVGLARPAITDTAPTGVGVLGRALLPEQGAITETTLLQTGVCGLAPEQGVGIMGAALSRFAPITVTAGAGVAGVGARAGVEGRALLPRDAAISIPATLTRGVTGISSGLGVLGLSHQATVTLTDATLRRAGVVGFGAELGVWGSAGSPLPIGSPLTWTVAVLGTADGPEAKAVVARNPSGVALEVVGAAAFKGGGKGVVPAGTLRTTVEDASISPESLVNVTLAGDPGNASTVHFVRAGDGMLELVLTVPPRTDTPFNYFVYRSC